MCIDGNASVTIKWGLIVTDAFFGGRSRLQILQKLVSCKQQSVTDTENKKCRKLFLMCRKVQQRTQRNYIFSRVLWMTYCALSRETLQIPWEWNFSSQNINFNLEARNGNGDQTFVDLNINVNDERKTSCQWYQKLTDNGIKLNFRSHAPLQHKKKLFNTEKTLL